jgi:hypothetical protein
MVSIFPIIFYTAGGDLEYKFSSESDEMDALYSYSYFKENVDFFATLFYKKFFSLIETDEDAPSKLINDSTYYN